MAKATELRYQIMPLPWFGDNKFPKVWDEIEWLRELPETTYFALYLRNPSNDRHHIKLPPGHPLYVVAFFDEPFDHAWLLNQCQTIKEPIIVLNDGQVYDLPLPPNVFFYQYHSWHYQFDRMAAWHPTKQQRNVKFKASAVCNRITQSKLLIFSALIQKIDRSESLIRLSSWLEEKNVHGREYTGIAQLDKLADYFFEHWHGKELFIDEFFKPEHNFQQTNSNPWLPLYLDSALHFTNESYHYSLMNDELGQYIRPGPSLSEKTYKCLLAGTPFISVAQFDVYRSFEELGLRFDYGSIDLSWDQDPGNLTRLCSIVNLIDDISKLSIEEIEHMTTESTQYNFDQVWSGDFRTTCQTRNEQTIEKILAKFL